VAKGTSQKRPKLRDRGFESKRHLISPQRHHERRE